MRKFKPRQPRSLPFRLLVILASALLLMAAFAPCANAALIRYYNFEGTPTSPYPVNLDSHFPAVEAGGGVFGLQLHGTGWRPVSRRQYFNRGGSAWKYCSW